MGGILLLNEQILYFYHNFKLTLEPAIFNTREVALCVWLSAALIFILWGKSSRTGLMDVLKSLFAWKIMSWLLAMATYISAFIYLFFLIGLWTPDLLKDTIFYFLFSATVGFFKANKISEDKHFFLEMLKDNLKLGIFMEFLIGQYTYELWVELLIVPIGVLLAGMQAITLSDIKYTSVNKLINSIWLLAGVFVIYHVTDSVFKHFNDLLSLDILRQILLVPNLTLVFIPFLYVLSWCMVYEEQFILLSFKLTGKKLKRFAKYKAMLRFNTDLSGLKRWVNRWNLSYPQTKEEIVSTINALKAQQAIEKAPPVVLSENGWSPYLAIKWLPEEKLRPEFYDPGYEDSWSARSSTLKIDKDWSGNGITYSVTGTRLAANHLELRLAAYEPSTIREIHHAYIERAVLLYKAAIGAEPPQKLIQAITAKKDMNYRKGYYSVELRKSTWGNITEGYDLILAISIKGNNLE